MLEGWHWGWHYFVSIWVVHPLLSAANAIDKAAPEWSGRFFGPIHWPWPSVFATRICPLKGEHFLAKPWRLGGLAFRTLVLNTQYSEPKRGKPKTWRPVFLDNLCSSSCSLHVWSQELLPCRMAWLRNTFAGEKQPQRHSRFEFIRVSFRAYFFEPARKPLVDRIQSHPLSFLTEGCRGCRGEFWGLRWLSQVSWNRNKSDKSKPKTCGTIGSTGEDDKRVPVDEWTGSGINQPPHVPIQPSPWRQPRARPESLDATDVSLLHLTNRCLHLDQLERWPST